HVDVNALARAAVADDAPTGGRAYLERRRAELHAGERVREAIAAVADDIHRALGDAADDAALLPARGQALNAAYLVRARDRDAFMTRVDELERVHGSAYVIEVSGPWPPYTFTTVDVAGARS